MATDTDITQLALHGGPAIRNTPFPARGHIGEEEKAAVNAYFEQVISSGVLTPYQGDAETAYCTEFTAYLNDGCGYADAVSSGSAAIYVALKALQLEAFSEVIIGSFTDPGGMMPIPLLNLIPMIADSAAGSYNSGPQQIEALISPRTSAIVVPHIGGEPADIPHIAALARQHGIPLLEDCAQAHGATYNGQMAGTFGDIAVFSTMSGKHHSSGAQGGMVYTQDEALYQEVRRLADRGKPYFLGEDASNVQASLNFNQTDLAAVIGRIQLHKLPDMLERRRSIAGQLIEGIADLKMITMRQTDPGIASSYWFLPVAFHPAQATCDKETFCESLRAEGLALFTDYRYGMPHRQKWFVERRVFGNSGYPWASPDYHGNPDRDFPCPNAQAMLDSHFIVSFHENWGVQDVDDALAIFHKVAAAYTHQ